jgi:hypothetical protein
VLRFEAIAHNTAELRCGRMIEKFPEIVTRLAGIVERFATALDCVDTGFLGDGILDELPTGVRLGATRVGGVDLNKSRMRDALRAALALAPAPNGFTVAEFAAKVHPHRCRSLRLHRPPGRLRPAQAAGQTPRRQAQPNPPLPRLALAARTIAALLTLRDQVIAPILAVVCSPRMARKPAHWTRVDRDYERIRIDMQTLFSDLAIETPLAA